MLTSLAFYYCLSAVVVSLLSFGRRISFINALTISIFLTPISGLITVLNIGRSLRVSGILPNISALNVKKNLLNLILFVRNVRRKSFKLTFIRSSTCKLPEAIYQSSIPNHAFY